MKAYYLGQEIEIMSFVDKYVFVKIKSSGDVLIVDDEDVVIK